MATYIPTYSQEDETLPEPAGVFGKTIKAEKSNEQQCYEASKMLEFIETEGTDHYNNLVTTSTPIPLLIKVPGTHTVRFITGLAPFVEDIFTPQKSPLSNHFLAIVQDIDNIKEDAVIIRLPPNILKVNAVMAPTKEKFQSKLKTGEDTATGTSWFQQNAVKDNTVEVAKVAPLPPYLAYDAFTEDIPAHLIWERIQMTEQDDNMDDVFEYTKNFLMAAHVNYNTTNTKNLQVDSQFFMERQSPEAKQWGHHRTNVIYPQITSLKAKEKGPPLSINMTSALSKIIGKHKTVDPGDAPSTTTQMQPADVAEQNYKKYGMSEGDLNRTLQLCGLQPGQQDQLPEWFSQISEKNLSTDGKRSIIKILFKGNFPYEEHEIPATPTVLDLAIK